MINERNKITDAVRLMVFEQMSLEDAAKECGVDIDDLRFNYEMNKRMHLNMVQYVQTK